MKRNWRTYARAALGAAAAIGSSRNSYGTYRSSSSKRRKIGTAYRKAASRTRTKTRTKSKPQYARRTGTGTWRSFSGWKKPMSKAVAILKKTIAPHYFTAAAQNTVTTALSGQIDWGDQTCPMNLYTPYDIVNYNMQDVAVGPEGKTALEYGQLHLTGTNISNANAFLDIYTIVARRDDTYSNPIARYLRGMANLGYVIGDAVEWGRKFTQVPDFNAYYKIIKVTKLALGPGESFQHYLKVTPNRVINTAYLYGDGNDIIPGNVGAVKGLTTWLLPIAYGAPYEDISGPGFTSTSRCRIAMNYSVNYKNYCPEKNDMILQSGSRLVKSSAAEPIENVRTAAEVAYAVAN